MIRKKEERGKGTLKIVLSLSILLAITLLLLPSPASATWHNETVDVGANVGQFSSIAINSTEALHISYYNTSDGGLYYAWNDQGAHGWHIELVEAGAGNGQDTSIAINSTDAIHISYYDQPNGDLRHAWRTADSATWNAELVDGTGFNVGTYTSIKINSTDALHISYYNISQSELLYAWNDQGAHGWHTSQVVDGALDNAGTDISMIINSTDAIHISYYDTTATDLNHAWRTANSAVWNTETVDGAGFSAGQYTSITTNSTNALHISYYNSSQGGLYHAWYDYGAHGWHTGVVDGLGTMQFGQYTSIAVNSTDNVHISYYNGGASMDLRHAWFDTSWHTENVDTDMNVGTYTSMAINSTDSVHISYYKPASGDLKHAWEGVFPLTCGDLNTADSIYTLTNNIASTGTCFNILANNVTIDCNGYSIEYGTDGVTLGYGVNSTGYNFTTIENCNISEGDSTVNNKYAVYFNASSNGTVQDNNITTYGVDSFGVYFNTISESGLIDSNNVTTHGQEGYGIDLRNSILNVINSNIVTTYSSQASGIHLSTSNSNNITYNNVSTSANQGIGVYLQMSSNYNDITFNNVHTSGPNGYGILLDTCDHNNASLNTVLTTDLVDASEGIFLFSASSNTLYLNTITTLGPNAYGIYFASNADWNNVNYNIITTPPTSMCIDVQQSHWSAIDINNLTNCGTGIYFNSANNNEASYNLIQNILNYGIRVGISNNVNISRNTIQDVTGQAIRSEGSNVIIANNTAWSSGYGLYLLTDTHTIYNNNLSYNTQNVLDSSAIANTWSVTPYVTGSIIGTAWVGGNYFDDVSSWDNSGDNLGDTNLPYDTGVTAGGDSRPLVLNAFVDTTHPIVSSVTPINGTLDVLISSNPTVTFNDSMNNASILSNYIYFSAVGRPTIYGTITTTDGITFSVNPSSDLYCGEYYTATVTTGVQDKAENNMTAPYSWNFYTKSCAPVGGGGGGAIINKTIEEVEKEETVTDLREPVSLWETLLESNLFKIVIAMFAVFIVIFLITKIKRREKWED